MVDYKDKYYNKQKFYTFDFTQKKWNVAQTKFKSLMIKHFRTGIIMGFFVECLIINTNIYENSVKKSTVRRLENKSIEDKYLRERRELTEKEKPSL
jgi:mannosyltransferase OCH1-like enzyme